MAYMVVLWTIIISIILIGGFGERFGDGDKYTCHCDGGSCDNVTGYCSTGQCDIGWSGPTCQNENVAFNKTASQSSYFFFYYPSEYAIDGNTSHLRYVGNHSGQSRCIFTDTSVDSVWWAVDLGDIYPIRDIKIFYRQLYLANLRGFSLLIGDEDSTNQNECFHHTNQTLSDVYTVHCEDTGRFINITNSREDPPYPDDYSYRALLELCEVEVFVCSIGTFGDGCASLCYCKENVRCDVDTGVCPDGCLQGWTRDNCSIACEDEPYGKGCNKDCKNRKCNDTNSPCNPGDGYCVGGCLPGWTGVDCTEECPIGTYGNQCSGICVERHCEGLSPCNRINGNCTGGCTAGWRNGDCSEICEEGFYGVRCSKSCAERNCKKYCDCNPVNGSCNGSCLIGFTGVDCLDSSPAPNSEAITGEISSTTGGIIGGAIGLLLGVIIGIVIFYMYSKRNQYTMGDSSSVVYTS